MRHRIGAFVGLIVLALTMACAPSAAASAAPASTTPGPAAPGVSPTADHLAVADPTPECNGSNLPCWEYQSWYWTYANCNADGRRANPAIYQGWVCVGHDLVVWLWLHKYHD